MAKNIFSSDMDLPFFKKIFIWILFWVAFIFCIFLRNSVNLSPKRKTKKDALLHIALFLKVASFSFPCTYAYAERGRKLGRKGEENIWGSEEGAPQT